MVKVENLNHPSHYSLLLATPSRRWDYVTFKPRYCYLFIRLLQNSDFLISNVQDSDVWCNFEIMTIDNIENRSLSQLYFLVFFRQLCENYYSVKRVFPLFQSSVLSSSIAKSFRKFSITSLITRDSTLYKYRNNLKNIHATFKSIFTLQGDK